MLHDSISCIAAGEQNLQPVLPPQRLVRQLPTVHTARPSVNKRAISRWASSNRRATWPSIASMRR